jgi:hypothetical protein
MNNIKRLRALKQVDLVKVIPKIVHGWKGNAKGMLQVAWEQGLIGEHNASQYTVNGCKDEMGILLRHTSSC